MRPDPRLLLCCLICSYLAGIQAAIPVENFARLPSIESINLSPDGKNLVMLRAHGDTYHVVTSNITSQKSKLLMAADPSKFRFNSCRFANNKRVVCEILTYDSVRSDALATGSFYREGRTIFRNLLAVNIDGSNVLQLVPKARTTTAGRDIEWSSPEQSTVVSWLPDDDSHILMAIAREDRLHPSVYRLNINNNQMKRVRQFNPSIDLWFANDKGVVLAGLGLKNQKLRGFSVRGRHTEAIDISRLAGASAPLPLGIAADQKSLWVAANDGDLTVGIHRVSLQTGKTLETLTQQPDVDVTELRLDPVSQKPLFATYYRDHQVYEWYDKAWQKSFNDLIAAIPGAPSRVDFQSFSADGNQIVISTQGNETLPTLYLYDRSRRSLATISSDYADVGPIVELQSVAYAARDGLQIPAYLALPGPAVDGPYPTIILPHGGPYARDTDYFDYWVQYFVSRGYAVLKPNFRGSQGYGDDFLVAGFDQWGLKMQDDVIDGLDWMVAEKYTDPARVCIVGGSYGGYVASVAAYKTPERFRCAISFAGVSSLEAIVKQWEYYRLSEGAVQRVQNGPLRDANSPLNHVQQVAVPLLIVHGDLDRRVFVEQSRDFVVALKEAGKLVTYIEQADGNHNLSLQHHRTAFFLAMDKFLQSHLGSGHSAE